MVYAYDQWVPLPTKDLYDTQLMLASINAAKDMYDKAEKKLDAFGVKYGDFQSPIKKDVDWWNNNVIAPVQNKINEAYANGIDLLRSPQGRLYLSQITNRLPYGDMAKVKQSAKAAEKYQDAVQKLQISGLYNPEIEKYEGKSLGEYSTLGENGVNADGIWNRMSPTPYENLGKFTEDYFKNVKPSSRNITRNGNQVAISEVTEQQLRKIAEDHFDDLVNTPQGQLMYKRELDRAGGNPTLARQYFNEEIYNANKQREFREETRDDHYFEKVKLALDRDELNWKKRVYAAKQKGTTEDEEYKPGTNISNDMLSSGIMNIVGKSSVGKMYGLSSATQLSNPNIRAFVEHVAADAQTENISKFIQPSQTRAQYIRFKTQSGKMSGRHQVKVVQTRGADGKISKRIVWADNKTAPKRNGKVIPPSEFLTQGGKQKYSTIVERDRVNASTKDQRSTLNKQISAYINANTYKIPTGIIGGYYNGNGKIGSASLDISVLSNIYSPTDIIGSAHGFDRTRSDISFAKSQTEDLRTKLKGLNPSAGKALSVVGTDKAITVIDRHGRAQNYQICYVRDARGNIPAGLDDKTGGKFITSDGVDCFLVRLPQKTQSRAGFEVTHNTISTSIDDSGEYVGRGYGDNRIMKQFNFGATPIKGDPMMDSYDIITNTTDNPLY